MSYLTLKANFAMMPSTFTPDWYSIGAGGMQYRAVGATDWINATQGTLITVNTTGIELKADTIRTSNTKHFSMTGSISASGDVTSLTNGVGGDCALNGYCYYFMFADCAALTTAPVLPATTLADNCYHGMFSNCTSLTAAPALPATTLLDRCYANMFNGCSSLTTPPTLPSTETAFGCYFSMFSDCTSLIYAPALPATILSSNCYSYMFSGCSSLIGYITPEPNYTLIHNYPSTSITDWNTGMYSGLNAASTVPATPSSGVNYYFKSFTPPITIEGKTLDCFGYDQHSI